MLSSEYAAGRLGLVTAKFSRNLEGFMERE
jgi:hypothetical protein